MFLSLTAEQNCIFFSQKWVEVKSILRYSNSRLFKVHHGTTMWLWSNKKCNIILLYLYLIKTWFWFAFPVLPATFYQRQVQINNHLTWRPPEKHFLPILHMLAWSPLRLFCWKYHWSNTSYSLWNLDVLFFHISLIFFSNTCMILYLCMFEHI